MSKGAILGTMAGISFFTDENPPAKIAPPDADKILSSFVVHDNTAVTHSAANQMLIDE